MLTINIAATTLSEYPIGILMRSMNNIFKPIKIKITAKPYLSKENRSAKSASKKYIALSPIIAKILDVNTMNGSVVTANIAGILSTAKIRSLISTSTSTTNNGVK